MNKDLHPRPVDIMIAGAQKAATSSLQNYMREHPGIITHATLEFTYFVLEEEWNKGYDKSYHDRFDKIDNARKVLAKNVGIMYWEHSLERLKKHNPDVKIIIVLRNPVDRAYSAFWYARLQGYEYLESFEEAMRSKPERVKDFISRGMVDYIGRGEYAKQIEMVYRYFDKSQVLILIQDDMKNDLKGLIKKVFDFCELDSSFVPDLTKKYNESSQSVFPEVTKWIKKKSFVKQILKPLLPAFIIRKAKNKVRSMNSTTFSPPKMEPETRKYLLEIYKPLNEQLENLTGLDLSSWNH